ETAGLRGGGLEVEIDGRAYLLGGDIITAIDGRALDSSDALADVMHALTVGGSIRLRVVRDGPPREVVYTLVERPILPSDVSEGRPLVRGASGRARRAAAHH